MRKSHTSSWDNLGLLLELYLTMLECDDTENTLYLLS